MDTYYVCNKNLFSTGIMFVDLFNEDTQMYISDDIFIDNKIKIKNNKSFCNPRYDYIIRLVTVSNKKLDKFEYSMKQLVNKMLLRGNVTYVEDCKEIINEVLKGYLEMYDEEGSNK